MDLAAFEFAGDNDEKKCGHSLLNLYDITNNNQNKYIIEKDLRFLKNRLNLSPLFVRLDEHVRALITNAILRQFVNVFIEQTLKPIEITSESFFEKVKYCSPAANLSGAGKTIIKHFQIPEQVKTAIQRLGISDRRRSQIGAQLK